MPGIIIWVSNKSAMFYLSKPLGNKFWTHIYGEAYKKE
jgi:hypothetical protein